MTIFLAYDWSVIVDPDLSLVKRQTGISLSRSRATNILDRDLVTDAGCDVTDEDDDNQIVTDHTNDNKIVRFVDIPSRRVTLI